MGNYQLMGILYGIGAVVFLMLWLLFHIIKNKRNNPNKHKND